MGRRRPSGEPTEPAAVRTLDAAEYATLDDVLGAGRRYKIALAAGLTCRHVTRVLQGKNEASMEAAGRIADAAGVGLDDLRAYIEKNKRRAAKKATAIAALAQGTRRTTSTKRAQTQARKAS